MTKVYKCRIAEFVVLIKTEMYLAAHGRKGRDSLSPELVDYLRYSPW